MRRIAVYGKGGIGKSTLVSNLSITLARMDYRVMIVGCDPKADSTKLVLGGGEIKTVLKLLEEKGEDLKLKDIIRFGFEDVICIEAGGPPPGVGCAGRGVAIALEQLEELRAYEVYKPDFVFYDVLGDVVCGGFTIPIREGFAEEVYLVTSAEMMALYAADNISQAIKNFSNRSYAELMGIIHNSREIENEDEIVGRAADEIGTKVIGKLSRSHLTQKADQLQKTVSELYPDSLEAKEYEILARKILFE